MDNGQEQWDRLINMPQSYEEDPSIVQRAIEKIEEQKVQPKKNWWLRHKKAFAACGVAMATAILAICIGIPLYNKLTTPQIVYYEDADVIYEDIENPTTFILEKELDILYFDNAAMCITKVANIIETREVGFLVQETLHISENGFFDKVILHSVEKKNVEFKFYDDYKNLTYIHQVKDISVSYQLIEMPTSGNRQILAKFTYENGTYFLDIVTEQDGLQQLEVYINMLLG